MRGGARRRTVLFAGLAVVAALGAACWLLVCWAETRAAAPREGAQVAEGDAGNPWDGGPSGDSGDRATADSFGTRPEGDGMTSDGGPDLPLPDGLGGLAQQGWTSVSFEEEELEQVATRLLVSYRDAGDCVLVHSGYLDLMGSVWCCVIRGESWADVCVVAADDDGEGCGCYLLRLERDEVAQLLGSEE